MRSAASPYEGAAAAAGGNDGNEDRIEQTLFIAAPPAAFFAALTDSNQLSRWFAPISTMEPRVGALRARLRRRPRRP